MVTGLFHPLNIFILGLGGGFLIPILAKLGRPWLHLAFGLALAGITVISAVSFLAVLQGDAPIDIFTAGAAPPVSINLRFGRWEGFFTLCVNVVAVIGAWQLRERLRGRYAALLLYLIMIMGLNGMVMTRDLFNLFVFLEIVSIATYGLLGLERAPAAMAASFKYVMATVLASTFFLLGTGLLYYVTGTLNIDAMIAQRAMIAGPFGFAGLMLLLACLLVELKPFPANGWGLDVYETAPSGVAALVSVGVSAGVFFALFKLLPLFEGQLDLIAVSGGLTFLAANLIGLSQARVQRLLGYSSVGQMGLLTLALALLRQTGGEAALPLVVGGLFVNHLLAKAGLFWLAGAVRRERAEEWLALARRPLLLVVFAVLVGAIAGLPPFPGFWAKWRIVMHLAGNAHPLWIVLILTGSLLEAAYMFRWLGRALSAPEAGTSASPGPGLAELAPALLAAALLVVGGYVAADLAGAAPFWLFAPLLAGALLYGLDGLPGRVKGLLMLALVLAGGLWLTGEQTGLNQLFSALLLAGSVVIAAGSLYRTDARPGFHALMTSLLLSVPALLHAATSLEFFFTWEVITLASYFLIAQGRRAERHLLPFLLFSLASAFFMLAGFGFAYAASGTVSLAALAAGGAASAPALVLLAIGFLIKAGAVGVHVWLPGAYAEADDDVTAILSAVISKVAIFGLLVGTYLAIRSQVGLDLAHVMAWIGLLTTVAGALMALRQDDIKRLLAYSSMSQLGYIVTAIALMSHLGWVTALYLVANHLMVKGILFLAVAGLTLRTGTRLVDGTGGLARNMPLTFATVVIAVVAMSGLPPLTGFGGKWLLLSAMADKGWYGLVVMGLLATFIGFLYMARIVQAVFLGERRRTHREVREAPLTLLVPQAVLVAGIVLLSFYPKLVIEPISAAIDPYFASTLVWEGMSLETIYGYWNPVPVMVAAVAVALLLFAVAWLVHRSRPAERGARRKSAARGGGARFYAFYRSMIGTFVPPVASAFWTGVSAAAMAAAGGLRMVYTGNGQTYALHVLYYFLALYLAGGAGSLWFGGP